MRTALFLLSAIAIFLSVNVVTIRALVRIHPQRRRWIIVAAVAGNLMWLFMPTLRMLNGFSRVARATAGPFWFAWNSFAILYAALMAILALLWLVTLRRRPFASFARWPSRIFLTASLIGSAVGFYQALVPLRIERVPITLADLPAEADGMRLVLMADLHVGLFTRPSRLETIFAAAGALDPQAVIILGDLIDDDPHFVPKLLAGTRRLGSNVPIYAVLGNHEMYGDPLRVIDAMQGSRIELLVNRGVRLGPLWLAGVSDRAANQLQRYPTLMPDLARSLAGSGGAFPVIASHQPRIFYEARERKLPLTVSGHTHGGQCGIRPLGWSLAGVFLEYHMGLYRWGASQLYINTGTGYWLVPFRLGMTPEITLIELRRARATP